MFIASLPSENQKKHQEFSHYSLLYTLYTTGCDIWLLKTNKQEKDNFYQNEEDKKYKNEKKVSKWSFTQSTFALGTTAFFIKLIHSGLSKKISRIQAQWSGACSCCLKKHWHLPIASHTTKQSFHLLFIFPFSCDTYARVFCSVLSIC